MQKRNFLFLQGPTSPFFSKLGDRLISRGARVFRVNFNMGDYAYWRNKPSWQYRKGSQHLSGFLEEKITSHQITDIIMVGDTRPVNAAAVPLARRYNVRLHIFEEGYLRPSYLTLEEEGINGHSRLPRDADWYRKVGPQLPPIHESKPVRNPVVLLGLHEVGYHLPGLLNPVFYSGYRTHRPHISPIELTGWAYRFSKMPYFERRDEKRIADLISSDRPYYILPLQLDSDSQIQTHSALSSMSELILKTLTSFAQHAPRDSMLVIKNHPLDTGFVNFHSLIKRKERELGIEGRTLYLESGHLPTLLDHCQGVIVVNSTVGTSALIHGCKTLALSNPVYDIPGLTLQCSLNDFWCAEHTPDKKLLEYFRRVVIHTTQINGGFYSSAGIALGVESACQRLLLKQCPLKTLLDQYPISAQQHVEAIAREEHLQPA